MSEAVTVIEAKLKELTNTYNEKFNFLNQIATNITQLNAEKVRTETILSEIRGAMNCLPGALQLVKKDLGIVDPVVEPVAVEPAPLEGEVIPAVVE